MILNEKEVIKRITFRLIPGLIFLYFIAYIDRASVGFAQLHMGAERGISDIAYGMGAGLFFIGYFIFEVPSNLLLDRYGANRWIARILVTWGIITMAMALIQGPISFYILRFLLGAAEAGFFPGVLYYITRWFPMRHRGKILGFFILSQPMALLITGPLAGLILGMNGIGNLAGWQWLFIIVGLPAVLCAWPTLKKLPNQPQDVSWLSNHEKEWLLNELSQDEINLKQTRHANPLHALKDKRVLTLALYYLPVTLSIYGLSLWLPIILKQFSSSDMQIGLLSTIPYFFGVIGLLFIPRSVDRTKKHYQTLGLLYTVGAISMFLSAYLGSPILQLAAISLVALCLFSTTAIFWTLPGRFLVGSSAAAGIALINSVGNLGGYLGPFGIGYLKNITGSLASGLYFLTLVMILGVILTLIIYKKLEKKSQVENSQ